MVGWLWVALLASPVPMVIVYLASLMVLPQYHYVPALILAMVLLFVSAWDKTISMPSGAFSWSLLVSAAIFVFVGAYFWSPWSASVGFVLILGAALRHCNEEPSRWGLLGLWPLSWLLLRLPLNFDVSLTTWLQRVTARVSSFILDWIAVPHQLTGNVFKLTHGSLFVEEACSGIQSVFALFFCSVFWVVWKQRSLLLLPLYMLVAMLWAGIMNVMRVTAICVAQERWQLDWAHGWRHELLGYVCLLVAIALLISSDRLLRIVFYPMPTVTDPQSANPISSGWNCVLKSMGIGQLQVASEPSTSSSKVKNKTPSFAMLGGVAILVMSMFIPETVFGLKQWMAVPEFVKTEYWQPNKTLLSQIEGIEVIAHETSTDASNPALGIHSDLWVCRMGSLSTRVLVSQHAEVHDLCNCYGANGWVINQRTLVEAEQTKDRGVWDVIEANFVNSETVFGSLFFSTMDRQARPVRLSGWSLADFLIERVDRGSNPQQAAFVGQTLNIQLWTTSETPFTAEQIDELRSLHRQVREIIREDLASVKQ